MNKRGQKRLNALIKASNLEKKYGYIPKTKSEVKFYRAKQCDKVINSMSMEDFLASGGKVKKIPPSLPPKRHEYSSSPKTKPCFICGEPGLHWQKVESDWKLFSVAGLQHDCKHKPQVIHKGATVIRRPKPQVTS